MVPGRRRRKRPEERWSARLWSALQESTLGRSADKPMMQVPERVTMSDISILPLSIGSILHFRKGAGSQFFAPWIAHRGDLGSDPKNCGARHDRLSLAHSSLNSVQVTRSEPVTPRSAGASIRTGLGSDDSRPAEAANSARVSPAAPPVLTRRCCRLVNDQLSMRLGSTAARGVPRLSASTLSCAPCSSSLSVVARFRPWSRRRTIAAIYARKSSEQKGHRPWDHARRQSRDRVGGVGDHIRARLDVLRDRR